VKLDHVSITLGTLRSLSSREANVLGKANACGEASIWTSC